MKDYTGPGRGVFRTIATSKRAVYIVKKLSRPFREQPDAHGKAQVSDIMSDSPLRECVRVSVCECV